MQKAKNKLVNGFIISTFVGLYAIVSVISTIHVIEFFELSNPSWLAISLAIAFEIGAAASLASLIALKKMNKGLVWMLFFLLTAMQAMGNTYYAYVNLNDFQAWIELFGLVDEEIIFQKRVLSIVSGAILPIVALGFIKSLVDYIKPEEIWACNTCNACVQECPVNIDPLAIIVGLRQQLVLDQSSAPNELNGMFSNLENNGAPWQFSPADRANWITEQ